MNMAKIKSLVGEITEENLRFVDCFVGERMGLFIPSVGQCGYAITKAHTHPAYSFVLTLDDTLHVGDSLVADQKINGRTLIGMSPDFFHHEELSEGFSRYYAIMIDQSFYNEILSDLNVAINPKYHFAIGSGSHEPLLANLRSYMGETCKSPRRTNKVNALETIIAYQVAESFHLSKENLHEDLRFRVEIDRAVEFIHGAFSEKLTVEQIAREACISPSHLSHLFREMVGRTVMGYVSEIRLQNARKLLLIGDKSVSQVAHFCGFSSSSHFASAFKNAYGMTPRELISDLSKAER